jgi:hypothetical protein
MNTRKAPFVSRKRFGWMVKWETELSDILRPDCLTLLNSYELRVCLLFQLLALLNASGPQLNMITSLVNLAEPIRAAWEPSPYALLKLILM